MTPPSVHTTFLAARDAREQAYAPYSAYRVGAALCLKNEEARIAGCNVENASYGATICAERTAVCRAVAEKGPKVEFEHLVLVTQTPAPPCGMCLQVLSEFVGGEFPIYLATPEGIQEALTLNDFLPRRFNLTPPSSL
ncbi:MAG: cytidine deaminase [Verrucomicrobia bacterium]|nr:cytidine deaminase [Verrucomicrobiota bacterium]MCH8526293.1 cytidine deaminase [Kiritimatiellia bacterium]